MRVPAPRVFPREPKSLLQANITIDHRSQITEKVEKEVVLVVVAALGEHVCSLRTENIFVVNF